MVSLHAWPRWTAGGGGAARTSSSPTTTVSCVPHDARVVAVAHGDKRRHLGRASAVVTLARAFAAELEAEGFAPDRLHVVGHALPQAAAGPPPDAAPPKSEPLVVAAGRFVAKKSFDDWLDAIARLPAPERARFVLFGDGPLRARLEAQARALSVPVHFAGWQRPAAVFADADIFCLPSRDEPFGLVLLEAMAAGIACVATRTHGPADLIDDGVTGILVPPDDPQAMADAVDALLNDRHRRRALGAAAGSLALDRRFSLEAFAERLSEAVTRTLAQSG